jgi:quinol monooxygenase YgiN
MSAYGCYVKFTTHPGQRDHLVELLLEVATGAQTVVGCELYLINTSPTDATVVWVTEVWSSQAEHDAALTQDGAKKQIQRALPLLVGPPELIVVQPVGGKGVRLIQRVE